MKTLFSGVTMMASLAALTLSGLTFMKVNTLETELPEKVVASLPESPVATTDVSIPQDSFSESTIADGGGLKEPESIEASVPVEPVEIQPGQFSQQGYNNQVKMEIVGATRLPADEDGARQRVNVSIRVRRIVEEPNSQSSLIFFSGAKGRNPQTNEVYPDIHKQYTSAMRIVSLPTEAWGDAYVWLDNVPEDLKTMDIVFPDMAVFNNVPISD